MIHGGITAKELMKCLKMVAHDKPVVIVDSSANPLSESDCSKVLAVLDTSKAIGMQDCVYIVCSKSH